MISTIILNWNRDRLLKQTIESYFATVGPDRELVVVDNASSDGSVAYLKRIENEWPVKVIYLDENLGGEAYNLAIPLVSGDLIHLSENDQMFLPGWFEHVAASFNAFSKLGQLSLFGDTPTDDEAWEPKPAHLCFSKGKILYEAHGNVGTSSVLRAELFRDKALRVHNIAHGTFLFPADGRLSADVKSAGYLVAWSDRYYVRNVGHEIGEFERNEAYYKENYSSKPWVGVEGWKQRIEKQKSLPVVARHCVALSDRAVLPEKTPQDVNGKAARLWSMFDGFTAETEVLDFLYVLTRLIKPAEVLETGTWLGLSTCAIARGLSENGFGRVTTLEVNAEAYDAALQSISSYGFEDVVNAQLCSSVDFAPDKHYDLALFDSDLSLRIEEFRRFRPWLSEGAIVLFHDVSAHHGVVAEGVRTLLNEGAIVGFDFPTPRGLFIGKVAS